jgi:hypothetical protein
MGLDNIPHILPCKKQGTVVMLRRLDRDGKPMLDDDGQPISSIGCDETHKRGGCPYRNDLAKQTEFSEADSVTGMFGTPCWYRGKYGNYMLEALGISENDFYGDDENQTTKSPESCIALADNIDYALKSHSEEGTTPILDGEDITSQLRYAAWWLRWVAEKADGSDCWY